MRLIHSTLIVWKPVLGYLLRIGEAVLILMISGSAIWFVQRHAKHQDERHTSQKPPTVTTIVHNAVGELRAQRKLVVLQVSITADVTKQNERHVCGLSLGETAVLLRVPGQIQFVVPLDRLDERAVTYNAEQKRLLIRVPRPIPDPQIVGIDPSEIFVWRQVGWGRLRGSADVLENAAKREIISQLIHNGDNDLVRERAEREARALLTNIASRCAAALGEKVNVEIGFVP